MLGDTKRKTMPSETILIFFFFFLLLLSLQEYAGSIVVHMIGAVEIGKERDRGGRNERDSDGMGRAERRETMTRLFPTVY